MEMKNPKSFIVSSGRSGSTLLQSILNSSGQIYIPRESDFIARAYPFFNDKKAYEDADYSLLADIFSETSQDEGWGMEAQEIKRHLAQSRPQSFGAVFSTIFAAYCEASGIDLDSWAIKHPVLIASLDRIRGTYPLVKIVHICRDGRDVYLSYQKIHESSSVKFGPKGVVASALYWVDGLRRIESFRKNHQVFEITYEGLLEDTDVELRRLCELLDIDYRPSMVSSYSEQKQEIAKSFSDSIHQNLSKGLMTNNTRKYVKNMSRLRILVFELIASPYLRKYGYPLEYPFTASFLLSPFRRGLYTLARILNDVRYSRRDEKIYEKCSSRALMSAEVTGS